MKTLVLGATGMAGNTIVKYLCQRGYDVTAFSRKPVSFCKSITGDARNEQFFTDMLLKGSYDLVVNCIGVLNRFAEENKSDAVYLNSFLPHLIASKLKGTHAKFIHISTNCVFSGKTGFYREDSPKDGESFYDRSKALGEVDDENCLTLRTSFVGPDTDPDGIGLFNWFMRSSEYVYGFKGEIWNGVTSITLAKAVEAAYKENISGIYNLVNDQTISKYELLRLFNKYFRNDSVTIIPDNKERAKKTLLNTRKDFSFVAPDYETMIKEMKHWVEDNKELYPHYF
jgi:dTDP-4-dehydrorhamnose reductase